MKPTLQAIIVADHVYSDRVTGKQVVAGIFHNINIVPRVVKEVNEETGESHVMVPQGGYRAGSPFAYLSLTDVVGAQEFVLRYVNLSDEQVLFQYVIRGESKDRLAPVEIVVPLPMLPADKPGNFALELLWKGEPLGAYRINVARVAPEGEEAES